MFDLRMDLRLLPYSTCANSEGSGETARTGRLCDKYHNLVNWLKQCILANSSTRPLTFYRFPSKPKTVLQCYLHPQIGRSVSQLRHKKIWQISINCFQYAPMNTGTPIFKTHKIWHLSQFVVNHFLKYPNFMSKTTSLPNNMTEETD